jgi:hypothetical protein
MDKEILGEKAVPGVLRDDPHGQPIVRIGPDEAVLDVNLLHLEIGGEAMVEALKPFSRYRPIHLTPPDVLPAAALFHHELVVGRTPGMVARAHHERPHVGQRALMAQERLLVELGRRQVPVGGVQVVQAVVFQAVLALATSGDSHEGSRPGVSEIGTWPNYISASAEIANL